MQFGDSDIDCVTSVIYKENLTGIIIMGGKESGLPYSENDVQLLETFARMAAIVIENARLVQIQSEMIMDLSHDLKTPLTAIRMFAQFLQKRVIDDGRSVEAIQMILSENEHYANLISNLLDTIELREKGELPLAMDTVNMNTIIQESLLLFVPLLKEKKIEYFFDSPSEIPTIRADKDKIKQVMVNLISNSMKFTSKGGKITIILSKDNKFIKTESRDTGIGISEDDCLKIFNEKYIRTEQAKKAGKGGAGIGLNICKHIIQQHGGRIGLESKENIGSTFWFTLPLQNGIED